VHALGSNTFIIVRIMEPFWLYVALVVRGWVTVPAHRMSELEARAVQSMDEVSGKSAGSPA
jgi:hypothetical protein